mmetsp:Transcript_33003/g.82968  ORF Transcript_33003/g.82968 Transcript_33003/m.82968 type:complete len:260 (-) Transcript_33003:4482-5261(-)
MDRRGGSGRDLGPPALDDRVLQGGHEVDILEELAARHHLVEDHAKRVHVRLVRVLQPFHDLGREPHGVGHGAPLGGGRDGLAEAKVCHLGHHLRVLPQVHQQHVGRLEIAVYHALRVQVARALGNVSCHAQHKALSQIPIIHMYIFKQIAVGDELGYDAARVQAETRQEDNVGMSQTAHNPNLAPELRKCVQLCRLLHKSINRHFLALLILQLLDGDDLVVVPPLVHRRKATLSNHLVKHKLGVRDVVILDLRHDHVGH